MSIDNALASMAVKDLKSAITWYEALFGRPADSTPMPEVAEWKFPRGGWLQIYELPERAGGCSCTLAVSDIQEIVAQVRQLGVQTTGRSSGARLNTLMIVDPDGNSIAFAEALDKTMAQ